MEDKIKRGISICRKEEKGRLNTRGIQKQPTGVACKTNESGKTVEWFKVLNLMRESFSLKNVKRHKKGRRSCEQPIERDNKNVAKTTTDKIEVKTKEKNNIILMIIMILLNQ